MLKRLRKAHPRGAAIKRREQELQISVVRFLEVALPDDVFFFHVPNGGKRRKREAAIFKAMGVKAGVPDIPFLHDGRCFLIELKADDGTLSDNQKAAHKFIRKAGCPVAVCRSLGEVEQQLREWKIPLHATLFAPFVRSAA